MYNLTAVLTALQLSQSLVNPSPGANPNNVESIYKFVEHSSVNGSKKGHAQSCVVKSYDVPVQAPSFQPFDQTEANVFRYRQQQGVNLGSWFVHEQWMTPSIFECASGPRASETDIAGGWGSLDNARVVLEKHWDTFITAEDFVYLASIGINTVRIPVAHFTLGAQFMTGTPFEPYIEVYKNAWPRLLRAIRQAGDVGIGVLVDMHGAPGSQNGQQHSGVSDGQTNFFNSYDYQWKTIEALKFLVQELGPVTNVIGVQLLNEPVGHPNLEDFYTRATDAIRQSSWYGQHLPVYIHDAFDLNRFVPYLNKRKDFVIQDHHSYFVFTEGDSKKPADQHTKDIKGGIADAFRNTALGERRNLVIGEWSCALTEESLKNQNDKTQAQKEFCTAQMQVYTNVTAGWMFWSFKNEQCDFDPGWCFQRAVGNVLPTSFFSYGEITNQYQNTDASTKVRRLEYPGDGEIGPILAQCFDQNQRPTEGSGGVISQSQHRFEAIYQRQNNNQSTWNSTNPTSWNTTTRNDEGSSGHDSGSYCRKGFDDGFQSAKVFAIYGTSKLGFTEQYIDDALALIPSRGAVPSGTEQDYRTGFMLGLQYGESKVVQAIKSS